ncbi:unnamed protein product [Rotaria sp. Silwood2]|nr:unnamed protein product [Rotaria sp. Silwood2]CAF4259372.1 unnamed protein product [Rotaria sp. Silwood2]
MAELVLLEPIFPGNSHIDQLRKILNITDTPNMQTLNERCTAAHPFFDRLHNAEEELTMGQITDEHENVEHTVEQSIVWQMVQNFVPPSWINDDHVDDS